jgi:hypothetical protein
VRLEELGKLEKKLMIPGIEPATFRIVTYASAFGTLHRVRRNHFLTPENWTDCVAAKGSENT